jgi:hypothetical protein
MHGLSVIAAAGGQDRNQGARPGATIAPSARPPPEEVRTMAIDQAKLDEFLGRFVADLGAVFSAPAVVAGDKLGLYKALAAAGPSTPAELAALTATSERYVTEWLRGQAAGGYVSYDPAAGRYLLTEEQAFALADDTSPAFVPGAFQLATAAVKDEPKVTEAFRTGGGLGWGEHHADLWQGTERFFRPGYAANLVDAWIPALDGVGDKLAADGTFLLVEPAAGERVEDNLNRSAGPSTRPRCSSACPTPAPRAGPGSATRSPRRPGATCWPRPASAASGGPPGPLQPRVRGPSVASANDSAHCFQVSASSGAWSSLGAPAWSWW